MRINENESTIAINHSCGCVETYDRFENHMVKGPLLMTPCIENSHGPKEAMMTSDVSFLQKWGW